MISVFTSLAIFSYEIIHHLARWFILRRSGLNISLIVVNYVNNRHEEDPPVSVEA